MLTMLSRIPGVCGEGGGALVLLFLKLRFHYSEILKKENHQKYCFPFFSHQHTETKGHLHNDMGVGRFPLPRWGSG